MDCYYNATHNAGAIIGVIKATATPVWTNIGGHFCWNHEYNITKEDIEALA